MNKNLLSAALIAGFGVAAVVPQSALAYDGTITFTGAVTATSCNITGGGDFGVALPSVANTTLADSGDTAGQTQFNIVLTGCSAGATASAFFEQGANVDAGTGNLISSGTATNVQLQLLNDDGSSPIDLLDASSNNTTAAVANGGGGTLSYYVRYFATGQSAAGTVIGTQQYTINYQ